MKILVTGADILYNQVSNKYEVFYGNEKVFEDKKKDVCMMFALKRENLEFASEYTPESNVVYFNVNVG